MLRITWALILILFSTHVFSQPIKQKDNPKLTKMFEIDQSDRGKKSADWETIIKLDREHRSEVRKLLKTGQLRTSKDYFHAAMIFQHGETTEDYKLAFSLAQFAATLDPGNKSALWLTAATWDRILMSKKVPQWYGTQYHQSIPGGPIVLYDVNEAAVTDEERIQLEAPTLREAKEKKFDR